MGIVYAFAVALLFVFSAASESKPLDDELAFLATEISELRRKKAGLIRQGILLPARKRKRFHSLVHRNHRFQPKRHGKSLVETATKDGSSGSCPVHEKPFQNLTWAVKAALPRLHFQRTALAYPLPNDAIKGYYNEAKNKVPDVNYENYVYGCDDYTNENISECVSAIPHQNFTTFYMHRKCSDYKREDGHSLYEQEFSYRNIWEDDALRIEVEPNFIRPEHVVSLWWFFPFSKRCGDASTEFNGGSWVRANVALDSSRKVLWVDYYQNGGSFRKKLDMLGSPTEDLRLNADLVEKHDAVNIYVGESHGLWPYPGGAERTCGYFSEKRKECGEIYTVNLRERNSRSFINIECLTKNTGKNEWYHEYSNYQWGLRGTHTNPIMFEKNVGKACNMREAEGDEPIRFGRAPSEELAGAAAP